MEILQGDKVTHTDKYGVSAGFADSDAMQSRGEIKVRFTFGPRKGECRWMPLAEVKSVERCFDTEYMNEHGQWEAAQS